MASAEDASSEFRHTITDSGSISIITVGEGMEIDEVTIADFDRVIREQLGRDAISGLVIDLYGMRYMDSIGLRALYVGNDLANELGKTFTLVADRRERLMQLLSMTGLDRTLSVQKRRPDQGGSE